MELDLDGVLELLEGEGPVEDAEEHADGAAVGRRPGRAGRGLGQGRGNRRGALGRFRARQRKRRQSETAKAKQRLQNLQGQRFNESGRARTKDFFFPSRTWKGPPQKTGKGGWKKWTSGAVVRAGFAAEGASSRQIASQVDGAAHAQVLKARDACAAVVLELQQLELKSVEAAECNVLIKSIMFDESQFDLQASSAASSSSPLAPYPVLCSHAQWTFECDGVVRDEHICRPPKAICTVNSASMFKTLAAGPGGFSSKGPQATFKAICTSSDAHSANIKLLKYLEQGLPEDEYLVPTLCAQHRAGNVIEQATKMTGLLGGVFCVCKTMSRGHPLAEVRKEIKRRFFQDPQSLLVHDSVPVACMEEWSIAKADARRLIDLCCSFDESKGEDAVAGSRQASFRALLDFFDGPWTGPIVL